MNTGQYGNPLPVVIQPQQQTQKKRLQKTNFDIRLTLGDDGGQQLMTSIDISVHSHVTTNVQIKQYEKQLLEEISSKELLKEDVLLVFRFSVEKGREKDAMEFFEKGLDQQKNNRNISAIQTLFRRPKSAGQIQLKQCQGSILVIYRLYNEYLGQGQNEFFSPEGPGSALDFDFRMKIILKGNIIPCRKSSASLKPDYINMHITSNNISFLDIIQAYYKQNNKQDGFYNNDFLNLLRNLSHVKVDLKFNSFRKFIDYYDQIIESSQTVDENGDKVYKQSDQENQKIQFPLFNKGIFKEKVQCKMIYSDKIVASAVMLYKKQQVMFKMIAVLKSAFLRQIQ